MIVLDHMRCDLLVEKNRPRILYENEEISGINAVIPRIGTSATDYGLSVVQHFESMDVFTTLSSEALIKSRNKFRSLQILAANGLGVPKTILSNNSYTTSELLQKIQGPPYILKLSKSTHGIGVIKSDSLQNAETILDAFYKTGSKVLMQEFIEEADGADIRILIVNGSIVATMKRQARKGEFRSNLHRGGSAIIITPTDAERHLALRATELMGLKVAGVDILRSNKGPMVLEINASPGLEGIETTTGIDIAGDIISFVESKVKKRL